MLYENDLISIPPQAASIWLGALLGLAFGALAQRSRFCLRRGLVAEASDRRAALGVWAMALGVAVLGVQLAVTQGWVTFAEHRFEAANLPLAAILLGGLAFGAGMVLTRGCVSRMTVLSATGNLRALTVLAVFAIAAHATLKGVLAPLRTTLGSLTVPLGDAASLSSLPGGAAAWAALIALAAFAVAIRSGARVPTLAMAVGIGLLVPLGWIGTGFLLFDDFEPIALQSLSFTAPWADTLFWTIASTAIPAGFGSGLIGGVLLGSFLAAATARQLQWQSFETPSQTLRFLAGAVLMGVGGVLAGGCTVGAGLAGVPTLSLAAIVALGAIIAGALATDRLLATRPRRAAFATPAE